MIIDLRDAQTHAARPEPCASGCWDIPTTTWDPGLPSGGAGSPFAPGIQEQLELGISWDSNENVMVLYIYIYLKIVIEVHCLVTFLRGIHGDHFTIPNRDHVGLNPEIISMIYLNEWTKRENLHRKP